MENRVKPPKLQPGDEIRVIAPASAPDMIKLSRGISKLKKLGYSFQGRIWGRFSGCWDSYGVRCPSKWALVRA